MTETRYVCTTTGCSGGDCPNCQYVRELEQAIVRVVNAADAPWDIDVTRYSLDYSDAFGALRPLARAVAPEGR